MSSIGIEQVREIAGIINARLSEFGEGALEPLTAGHARIAFDEIEHWMATHACPVGNYLNEDGPAQVAAANERAYLDGYEAGRAAMAIWFYEQPDADAETPQDGNAAEPDPPHGFYPGAPAPANAAFYQELSDRQRERESESDRVDAAIGISDDDWCDLPATEGASSTQFWRNLDDAFSADETPPKSDENLTGAPPLSAEFVQLREDNKRAVDELALKQSAVADLSPAHTIIAPLVPRRPPDPDVARAAIANALANGSGGQLTALTARKPRTLAEADNAAPKGSPPMSKRGTILPTLTEMITELKRQSMASVMPSQSMFNYARPALWADAIDQTQRLKKSWKELAELAGLKQRKPGPQPRPVGSRQAAK